MTRPRLSSDTISKHVADILLPRVLLWLKEDPASDEVERIRDEVYNAIRRAPHGDSYRIANYLEERYYWSVDSDLVHIFEEVSFISFKKHDELVAAWVQESGVKPKFSVGAKVSFKDDGDTYSGEVTRVNARLGTYVVFCQDLGHVKSGTGTLGVVLPFEDASLTPICSQATV